MMDWDPSLNLSFSHHLSSGTVSQDPSSSTDMGELHDLIDERQVAFFNALGKLERLDSHLGSRFEVPRFVVVGDQNSGKSSVLEAIARFRFPVNDVLCTKYPTKLILRRDGNQEQTSISIEPGPSRTGQERTVLEQFRASPATPDDIIKSMTHANNLLLGDNLDHHARDDRNANASTMLPRKEFTDDVLVIRKSGPHLPIVDLVDLPGLFQASSAEQSGSGQKIVEKTVESTALRMIQEMSKVDDTLVQRVIGVLTDADRAGAPEEMIKILAGSLDETNLKRPWHVVKNQDKKERLNQSLTERDERERQFFIGEAWAQVPTSQKGIAALRATIKEAYWDLTRAEIPHLTSDIQLEIETVQARVEAADHRRDTHEARKEYLEDIGFRFEMLAKKACFGSHLDSADREIEGTPKHCEECKTKHGFFGTFGCTKTQETRLCANVRALSKLFASTMRRAGKTMDVREHFDDRGQAFDEAIAEPDSVLLPKDFVDMYRSFKTTERQSREEFDKVLAVELERWRGREPRGGANDALYYGFFGLQSRQWLAIASAHLDAVWKAVGRFVALALASACAEADVRKMLFQHVVEPRLKQLKAQSRDTLDDLLSCQGHSMTGFYDGFKELKPMQWHFGHISQRLTDLTPSAVNAPSRELFDATRDAMVEITKSMAAGVDVTTAAISAFKSYAGKKILSEGANIIGSAVGGGTPAVAETAAKDTTKESPSKIVKTGYHHSVVGRVIEHVETYYEMNMVAFVGYVNALVVEKGILGNLHRAILTHDSFRGQSEGVIAKIAGEKESVVLQQKRDRHNLQILRDVLETLEKAQEDMILG